MEIVNKKIENLFEKAIPEDNLWDEEDTSCHQYKSILSAEHKSHRIDKLLVV